MVLYLLTRCQCLRVDSQYSDWLCLAGGMPQGSVLGPLSFLLLIDDLSLQCLIHKYMDDTTLTELLISYSHISEMQTFLQLLQAWATNNKMKINYTKTTEMILGPLARQPPQPLSDGSGSECVFIEWAYHFKLLGINISHDMNWQAHIDAISHKAASGLHFLRILKKSGLKPHHLLNFYLTVIRPVLKYCSVVWHHGLTKAQSETLEAIQRRTLRIIYPPSIGMP